jgi:integrase
VSDKDTVAGNWRRSLRRLFKLAGIPDAHPHRFRDTFAVELLLAGVPIERVSILLSHSKYSRDRDALLPVDPRSTAPLGS